MIIGSHDKAAKILDEFLYNDEKRNSAYKKSKELAKNIYNWDIEKNKLLDIVKKIF